MKETTTEVGVIIGRFQLHELHEAHKSLLEHVFEKHEKVVILLGTSSAINTRRNPLDFITRKLMLDEYINSRLSLSSLQCIILPLPDNKSDLVWSRQIDQKVSEIFPTKSVTLYGSKDSFIPYYKGVYSCIELEPDTYISATNIRNKISHSVLASKDFRAGIIYSVYSQYPQTFPTIDIIIRRGDQILLGRKPTQTKWRFIGGFVDPEDETEIISCKREGREETGLELDNFKFVCSRKVVDWRYKGVSEKGIMTHLYECDYIFGTPTPMDDIEELKWFDLGSLELGYNELMVEEHIKLFQDYLLWK